MKVFYWMLFLMFLFGVMASSTLSHAAVVNGKVNSIQGEFIELDIGSEKGISIGDSGRIYYVVTVGGIKKPVYIAKLRITNVSEKSSVARIEDKEGEVKIGQLIEVVIKERKKEPKPGEVWRDIVTGMQFIFVKGGCFEMGCGSWASDCNEDEKPVHKVCVDDFWIGKYEVTQGQWKLVLNHNPAVNNIDDLYPVEMISWEQVKEFINKLTALNQGKFKFRLPTEAEWEYACRSGGKPERYSGGNNIESLAWYYENSEKSSHPVGNKHPNSLGIYDMSGNLWEWCEDTYHKEAYNNHQQKNSLNLSNESYRVCRGGSWYNDSITPQCTRRAYYSPNHYSIIIGVRLVREY